MWIYQTHSDMFAEECTAKGVSNLQSAVIATIQLNVSSMNTKDRENGIN